MSTNLLHVHSVWRQDELRRINETTAGPERKAALCALLEQEAQLIASIGRHKITAGQKNKEEATRRFLDMVNSTHFTYWSCCTIAHFQASMACDEFEVISCILLPLAHIRTLTHTLSHMHTYPDGSSKAVDCIRWEDNSNGHTLHIACPTAARHLQQCHARVPLSR